MTVFSKIIKYAATAAFAATFAYAALFVYKRFRNPRTIPATEAFKLNINLVSNSKECDPLIYELRRRSMDHNAIGFDCEWVTKAGGRKPVALLQLSTYDGFCVLVRLNFLDPLPASLTNLLQDISIYKVGVVPLNDANYLYQDHGLKTMATLDLRHFAEMCGCSIGGLAHLSETILGVKLDKSFKVRCGNWDAETLTPDQLHYAASDAHAAIRIFIKLVNELNKSSHREAWCLSDSDDTIWAVLDDVCAKYADINYKQYRDNNVQKKDGRNNKKVKGPKEVKEMTFSKLYPHLRRIKPLYDNCFLQAPDGEVLCTIDSKKAGWYVEKNLADIIEQDPLTVRLRFEPAGRSVGDVGKYYAQVKKNQCVVCGEQDSFIRKNVVPREYRKYFPDIMKDHSSHDIVLLCLRCHQRSNFRDQAMRDLLAERCRAPLPHHDHRRTVEDKRARKVNMSARALYFKSKGKYVLPEARKKELEAVLLSYYTDHTEVTDELVEEAMKLRVMVENEYYMESHGQAVVRHFLTEEQGGLLQLEELWRTHFLKSMRPQHLPELWSVCHNLERLRLKWNEGRLSEEELRSLGFDGFHNLTQEKAAIE